MEKENWYTRRRFLLMTMDPVHIGTGGYRLGRVDLSIVREPGTNLPKIPGTSLAGAARSYAAMRYGKIQCAGQGGGAQPHCGQPTCPICYTFGTARGTAGGSAGTVSISDARLLLFPVHSMAGPVWVTTKTCLEEAGFEVDNSTDKKEQIYLTWDRTGHLNLGWLMLNIAGKTSVRSPENSGLENRKEWKSIANRIVLVADDIFSHIVNSNLEVRTSVSIDPHTGAAAEGALFTYEALPRATWLWMDVVEDDYRKQFPVDDPKAQELNHQRPLSVVQAGLQLAEYLGIGGMGTRGFGRIKLVADWEV